MIVLKVALMIIQGEIGAQHVGKNVIHLFMVDCCGINGKKVVISLLML